jgi:Transglutaminase-like superfamily
MSAPQIVVHRPRDVSLGMRARVRGASLLARVLAGQPPARLRRLLSQVSRGAEPATYACALEMREAAVAVNLDSAGPEGCLRRTITVALLCRSRGMWPTWCVGATRMPPFTAHSWVEAEGELVGEDTPHGYFAPLMTVRPRGG